MVNLPQEICQRTFLSAMHIEAKKKKKSISINRELMFLNYDIFLQYNPLDLFLFPWKSYINTFKLKGQVVKKYVFMILLQ